MSLALGLLAFSGCKQGYSLADAHKAALPRARAWASDAQLSRAVGVDVGASGRISSTSGTWTLRYSTGLDNNHVFDIDDEEGRIQTGAPVTLPGSEVNAARATGALFQAWNLLSDSTDWFNEAGWGAGLGGTVIVDRGAACDPGMVHCDRLDPRGLFAAASWSDTVVTLHPTYAFLYGAGIPRPLGDRIDGGDAPDMATGRFSAGLGQVTVQQIPGQPPEMGSTQALAKFWVDYLPPSGCTPDQVGPCTVVCPPFSGGSQVTPGLVSVAGGMQRVDLRPPATPTWVGPMLFLGGEALRVTGSGADVPAFDASLSAPWSLTVTQPVVSGNFVLERAQPIHFAWDVTQSDSVSVLLENLAPVRQVQCVFPSQAGFGDVPAGAVGLLNGGVGRITVMTRSRTTAKVGPWKIDVDVTRIGSSKGMACGLCGVTWQ